MPTGPLGPAEIKDLVIRQTRFDLRVGIGELDRLKQAVADVPQGDLTATLQFQSGTDGIPQLELGVSGELTLLCQRCLQPLSWPVRVEARLAIVDSDDAASALADPFDVVVTSSVGIVPTAVVEDEVLAALPLVSLHEASECPALRDDPDATAQRVRNRPFAGLAEMLDRSKSGGSG